MPTFIILLRGVNVGKARRLPMADFKDLLLDLGCSSAVTLLNSGNAVVQAPVCSTATFAAQVGQAILDRFGLEVPVVVKTAKELAKTVKANELVIKEEDYPRFLVAFAQDSKAIAALEGLSALVEAPECLRVQGQAAYLFCPGGILQSKAAKALLGKAGKAVTTRNWATVLKLHSLAGMGQD